MSEHELKETESGVKTIDKMVAIFDCFTEENPVLSLAELASRLKIPKPSLYRHMTALEHHGLLYRDNEKQWSLGYRLFIWGTLVPEITTIRFITKQFLQDLVTATNESAILTIYNNHEVICVDKFESSHSVRMTLTVGSQRKPHAGASSKVLMAYLPDDEIQDIIKQKGLPKLSTNTITDPQELIAELARIRENGYAFSKEETDVGAWGVAAPIFNSMGKITAGIGIAGPTSRFSDELHEKYVVLCRKASMEITAILRGKALGTP